MTISEWLESLDFNLANGFEIVAPHFDRVSTHVMHQDFAVPEVDPLLNYLHSARDPIEAEVGSVPWDAFMTVLRQLLQQRLDRGPISYRTTQVVFECS